MTPPIRFMFGVVGLWCFGRAGVLLWPHGAFLPVAAIRAVPQAVLIPEAALAATPGPLSNARASIEERQKAILAPSLASGAAARAAPFASAYEASSSSSLPAPATANVSTVGRLIGAGAPLSPAPAEAPTPILPTFVSPALPTQVQARGFSISSWALWRPGEGGAAGFEAGTLGGSQAGVRALVPVLSDRVPRLAVSARVSAPLKRRGVETAFGLEWQPLGELPVRLLVERRQRIMGEGRSAFAAMAHGGLSERALGRGFALDAYGAAGVVGLRSRDLFAEGATTVTRKVGPVRVGAGAWGGAQPGTTRLDVGPTLALPLRVRGAGARVSLDYRLRVAGSAAPSSGPALTIGTDF